MSENLSGGLHNLEMMMMRVTTVSLSEASRLVVFGLTLLVSSAVVAEERVPAFTAYLAPRVDGASVSEERGITRWLGPATSVSWYGDIKTPGKLAAAVVLKMPESKTQLKLTVAGQSHTAKAAAAAGETVTLDFGSFDIPAAGYQRFLLESLNDERAPNGDLQALVISGPASEGAHFNLKERRNAASVHLAYPQPKDARVAGFYCEMTGLEDPVATYYMACGWHRGYFGMQVNSPRERRIIFSVWDSGNEAINRDKVAGENRVTLLGKGAGVVTNDFGNEGTGGHSHLVYPWKTGEVQKFYVTAEPRDVTFTVYTGYWFHPEKQEWMLISSWRAPKDGGYLRGLYSFSENFSGSNGHLVRKALYGNQWVRTVDGDWREVTTASFSHDPTGKADRLDRFMGTEKGQFFLSHGGFVPGFTKFGEVFTRPALGVPPELNLPPVTMPAETIKPQAAN